MSKFTNDEKVDKYYKRKVLRLIMMLFAFSTVVTAILCLLKITKLWIPLVLYALTLITRVIWEHLDFHDDKEEKKTKKEAKK